MNTLKKEIESGTVSTSEQMKHRLMRMFANAVMYNPTEHDINLYSKEMARDTLIELARLVSYFNVSPPILDLVFCCSVQIRNGPVLLMRFQINEGPKGPQVSTHHPRRSKAAEEVSCALLHYHHTFALICAVKAASYQLHC